MGATSGSTNISKRLTGIRAGFFWLIALLTLIVINRVKDIDFLLLFEGVYLLVQIYIIIKSLEL